MHYSAFLATALAVGALARPHENINNIEARDLVVVTETEYNVVFVTETAGQQKAAAVTSPPTNPGNAFFPLAVSWPFNWPWFNLPSSTTSQRGFAAAAVTSSPFVLPTTTRQSSTRRTSSLPFVLPTTTLRSSTRRSSTPPFVIPTTTRRSSTRSSTPVLVLPTTTRRSSSSTRRTSSSFVLPTSTRRTSSSTRSSSRPVASSSRSSAAPAASSQPANVNHISGPSQASLSSGPEYQNAILFHHNARRQNHNAAPLTWCSECEANARILGERCDFAHYIPPGVREGQNLFTTSGKVFNVTAAITESWYKSEFPYMTGSWGKSDLDDATFHKVGHLTQVVWKGTTSVGCVSVDCTGRMKINGNLSKLDKFTVCNYSPPGNIVGRYNTNVDPPNSNTNLGSWTD